MVKKWNPTCLRLITKDPNSELILSTSIWLYLYTYNMILVLAGLSWLRLLQQGNTYRTNHCHKMKTEQHALTNYDGNQGSKLTYFQLTQSDVTSESTTHFITYSLNSSHNKASVTKPTLIETSNIADRYIFLPKTCNISAVLHIVKFMLSTSQFGILFGYIESKLVPIGNKRNLSGLYN